MVYVVFELAVINIAFGIERSGDGRKDAGK
jgi:hypothetical protein